MVKPNYSSSKIARDPPVTVSEGFGTRKDGHHTAFAATEGPAALWLHLEGQVACKVVVDGPALY